MKKALFCFWLLVILLLAGYSASGSREYNFEKQNASTDLPDLTVRLDDIEPELYGGPIRYIFSGYMGRVYIKNSGTAPISKNDSPVLEILITAEKDGVVSYTYSRNLFSFPDFPSPMMPGYERYYTFFWESCPQESTLRACLDPDNLIEELDDDNNCAETVGPKSYSRSINSFVFLQQILFSRVLQILKLIKNI